MSRHILIVEDSTITRSMIRSSIEDIEGVLVHEAANGFEALKLLPSNDFSLIITDINMPDINGLELISFVKKDPRFKSIPLVIISTENSANDRERGMNLGANAYITKPFIQDDLKDTIMKVISQ